MGGVEEGREKEGRGRGGEGSQSGEDLSGWVDTSRVGYY